MENLLWRSLVETKTIFRTNTQGCDVIITGVALNQEKPDTWDWMVMHEGGMFYQDGQEDGPELAKEAALKAIPSLLKERDEYYARVNPKLYGNSPEKP